MPKTDLLEELLRQLEQNETVFFSQPFQLSLWERSGFPGEGYTSELFELRASGGLIDAKYVRTAFDREYHPPFRAEEFSTRFPVQQAAKLSRQTLESRLFRTSFSAEQKPPYSDVLKQTWLLAHGGVRFEKSLYEPFPSELDSLREAFGGAMEECARIGESKLLNPKRDHSG